MAILTPVDEIYLPGQIASGMVTPIAGRWSTTRFVLDSGHVQANQNWAHPLRRYELTIGPGTDDIFEEARDMLMGRRGFRGFLLRDHSDYQVVEGLIGVGDGVNRNFPLVKAYNDGLNPYIRPITRPVQSTTEVMLDGGTPVSFTWQGRYTVRLASAPALGVDVLASFTFDVPVALTEDSVGMSLITTELGEIDTFVLEEVRDG